MAQLGERLVTSRYFVQLPHIRRCHSNRGTALPESGLLLLATLTQLLAEDQEAAVDLTLGIQTRRSHEGVEAGLEAATSWRSGYFGERNASRR